jgi:predicted kinase
VERKRLLGLPPLADTRAHGVDAYTPELTHRTYARLLALARIALHAGFPVVLDAAFLRRDERAAALALAQELELPFFILACEAPAAVLRARLRSRSGDASEADETVLDRLREAAEPLTREERAYVAEVPPTQGSDR